MDRSRYILKQKCGHKDSDLFHLVMELVAEDFDQTEALQLFSAGKRRYGNILYDLCIEYGKSRVSQDIVPESHMDVLNGKNLKMCLVADTRAIERTILCHCHE
jgi:hypothetical protein